MRAVLRDVVDEKLKPISDELAAIRSDLKELKQKAENSAGLTKEIDHALSDRPKNRARAKFLNEGCLYTMGANTEPYCRS